MYGISMPSAIDILEKNVVAAAALIASLRDTVERLTRELERSCSETADRAAQAPPIPDPLLVDELERLRAERVVIRDGIRRLLGEIDKVSW
jgi:hypothetical protein